MWVVRKGRGSLGWFKLGKYQGLIFISGRSLCLLSGGWMASVGVEGRRGSGEASREVNRVVMRDSQEPGSSVDKLALRGRPG